MIDTQSIRSKILGLAMSGQLTEPQPNDGVADDLYQLIIGEKQTLIKKGVIKKEKTLPEISTEEIPFTIPSRWCWVHLGELFMHNTGKALNSKDTQGELLEYITTSNLYWDRFELNNLKKMPFTESEIEKCTVHKGDLLVCEGGDIGRSAIWPFDYEMRIQNHIHRLRRYSDKISTEFYYYLLRLYKQTGRINGIGIGLQGFSSNRVHSLIVPLAPYNEAIRIVDRIKQAFSVLDAIDELQVQYADNLTVLKEKLIDAAIQGKLTEQLPEDGTAEELYQQIQAAKQGLIKTGKIKKGKALPEITADEIPFDIPQNWKWVRLAGICAIINGDRGKNYPAKSTLKHEGIPFISALNLNGSSVTEDEQLLCLDDNQYERLGSGKLQKDDIVICIRGSLGKHGRYPFEKGAIASSLVISRLFFAPKEIGDYEMVWLDSSAFPAEIKRYDSGTAQPNLAANSLEKFLIPLPPLAEQKRIVSRLNDLFIACEGLI